MDFNMERRTGVVFDLKTLEHRNLWDPKHPEKPERISSILERCKELGLLSRCLTIPSRSATPQEISTIHTPEHVQALEKICSEVVKDVGKAEQVASTHEAVYFHPSTYDLALLACGSTIDLVQSVVDGTVSNGMAIIRPPGHHAMKETFCGFCYFNNVAVAAKKILDTTPVKRIFIVDFDVHHGQGTQQLFYDDPRVLYFSTHQFEHGKHWPSLEESNFNWIGSGDGRGMNCNVPLNKKGLGNADFLTIWHQVLIPMAYQFSPELVIVSAGFDAALGCPEGEMRVTPQCYPHLLRPLMGLANGNVAVILEGGYCLKSLAEGAALSLRTLLGDPCPLLPEIKNPDPVVVATILDVWTMLQDHWNFSTPTFLGGEDLDHCLASGLGYKSTYYFDRTNPKPNPFPTREYYGSAFQLPETFKTLDDELNELISKTSLAVASYRVGLAYNEAILAPEAAETVAKILRANDICRLDGADNVAKVMGSVIHGTCQSAIAFLGTNYEGDPISIAVKDAEEVHGLQRILVFDLDVTEGVGHHEIPPGVVYVSFGQSADAGSRFHLKIPCDKTGIENMEYLETFTSLVLPMAYEYAPQLIITSAEIQGDKFGGLTPECHAHITHLLSSLANGKIISILRGSNGLTSKTLTRGFPWGTMEPLQLTSSKVKRTSSKNTKLEINLVGACAESWILLNPFQRVLPSTPTVNSGHYY